MYIHIFIYIYREGYESCQSSRWLVCKGEAGAIQQYHGNVGGVRIDSVLLIGSTSFQGVKSKS